MLSHLFQSILEVKSNNAVIVHFYCSPHQNKSGIFKFHFLHNGPQTSSFSAQQPWVGLNRELRKLSVQTVPYVLSPSIGYGSALASVVHTWFRNWSSFSLKHRVRHDLIWAFRRVETGYRTYRLRGRLQTLQTNPAILLLGQTSDHSYITWLTINQKCCWLANNCRERKPAFSL